MTPDMVVTTVTEDGSVHSTIYFVRGDLTANDTKKRQRPGRLEMRRIEGAYWQAQTVRHTKGDGQGQRDTKAYKPFFTVRSCSTGKAWPVLGAGSSGHPEQFALLPWDDPQHLAKMLGISYPRYPLLSRRSGGRHPAGLGVQNQNPRRRDEQVISTIRRNSPALDSQWEW